MLGAVLEPLLAVILRLEKSLFSPAVAEARDPGARPNREAGAEIAAEESRSDRGRITGQTANHTAVG